MWQQVIAELNKGEAKNTLARAICFNRLGEIRDRTYDQHRYRASGLNLVIAAIILWNTVYLERAVTASRAHLLTIGPGIADHTHSISDICKSLGISRATLYRYLDAPVDATEPTQSTATDDK